MLSAFFFQQCVLHDVQNEIDAQSADENDEWEISDEEAGDLHSQLYRQQGNVTKSGETHILKKSIQKLIFIRVLVFIAYC